MSGLVRIVPLTLRFACEVQTHASDIRISENTRLPYPYPTDAAKNWIESLSNDFQNASELNFAILANENFVGTCGFAGIDRKLSTAEYGYWIVYEHWGNGFATVASQLALTLAKTQLGLSKLHSTTLKRNRASIRVLEKLGFSKFSERPSDISKWPTTDILCDFEKIL